MFLRKMKGEMKEIDRITSMMQSFDTDSGVVWEKENENKVYVSGKGRKIISSGVRERLTEKSERRPASGTLYVTYTMAGS
jgi:hypothetical protein